MAPKGRYLVALNKLSIDRFNPVGPLHPQNHQLIDIANDKMQLLYDMPLPLGEPHYVVAIEASKLKPGVPTSRTRVQCVRVKRRPNARATR